MIFNKDPLLVTIVLFLVLGAVGIFVRVIDSPSSETWAAIDPPRAGVDCWLHGGTREVVCIDAIAD